MPDRILFGTLYGEVVIANLLSGKILSSATGFTSDNRDSVLGLCWLHSSASHFVLGSSKGVIKLCEWTGSATMNEEVEIEAEPNEFSHVPPCLSSNTDMLKDVAKNDDCPFVVSTFTNFDELTSVHVNCNDSQILGEYLLSSTLI